MRRRQTELDVLIVVSVWGLVASLIVWALRIGKYIGG
jgi:hypothetical protein